MPTEEMSLTCPVCTAPDGMTIDERIDMPILLNRLYPTRAAAINAARGTISLTECESCGFVWNAAFNPSLIVYDDAYENDQSYSVAFQAHLEERASETIAALPAGSSLDYLEIGSGQGGFLNRVVKKAGSRLRFADGFDPAWRGRDLEEVNGARIHKVYFNQQTADRLRRPPNIVVSRHTIEHVPEPITFLRTIRDALGPKSRAKVFIETPCISWIHNHKAVQDIFYEHCSLFTAESLRHALEVCAFKVIEIQHVFKQQYLWAIAQADDRSIVSPPQVAASGSAHQGVKERFVAEWTTKVKSAHKAGPVTIWGAGAKGVTFAQLIDPDGSLIDHAVDINPVKQGMFLPGSGLRVLAPEQSAVRRPATVLVMNSNYLNEIRATAAGVGISASFEVID